MTARVLVLGVQSPFSEGGAERHVRRLAEIRAIEDDARQGVFDQKGRRA